MDFLENSEIGSSNLDGEMQRKKSSSFMGSNQFFIDFLKIFEKSISLIVFKLWDRFWTLPDGPLEPLDRKKNPKTISKHRFFNDFLILDPGPAIIDHLDL